MAVKYWFQILEYVGIGLLIALFIYLIKLNIRQEREKKQNTIIAAAKGSNGTQLFKLYKFFSIFKPTRFFLRKMIKTYSVRLPGDYRRSREEAMKMALIMWSFSFIVMAASILIGGGLYRLSCAFLLAFTFCKSRVSSQMEKYDLQIIKELDQFVDEVRHYYFETEMVEESIKEAREKSRLPLMKLHAKQIYDVLMSDDVMSAVKKYNNGAADIFLKKFMASTITILQYGDRTVKGESLYLSSIRDLKQDIQTELILRRNIYAKFKFLSGICVMPYLTLWYIEDFGVNSFASIKDVYAGMYGSMAKTVLFFTSIILYTVINRLRNTVKVEFENPKIYLMLYRNKFIHQLVNGLLSRNWGKTLRLRSLLKKTGNNLTVYLFTVKRMLYFVLAFVIGVVFMFGLRAHNKAVYLENIVTVMQSTSGASDSDCFEILVLTRHYLKKYKDFNARMEYNRINNAGEMEFNDDVQKYLEDLVLQDLQSNSVDLDESENYQLIGDFLGEFSGTKLGIINLKGLSYNKAAASSDIMVTSGLNTYRKMLREASSPDCFKKHPSFSKNIAETVASKIRKSQNQYFHWYDLIIAFLAALAAYNAPIIILMIEKKSLQMDMEDEVIQFQSVILILMYIERMTVEEILDWMLMFSRIFKPSLQKCVCYFPVKNEEALDDLAKEETYEPFRRLIENLKVCDKVGVETAFNGLDADRKNYQETRKQENEISLSKRVPLGTSLAFVPFYGMVLAYMLIPYFMAAMGDLSSALTQMSTVSGS